MFRSDSFLKSFYNMFGDGHEPFSPFKSRFLIRKQRTFRQAALNTLEFSILKFEDLVTVIDYIYVPSGVIFNPITPSDKEFFGITITGLS